MVRIKLFSALAVLALLAMTVNMTEAKGGGPPLPTDCQKKISLAATAVGDAIDASGTAEVRARGTRQKFTVSMDARVAAGTVFAVTANTLLAGSIMIDSFGNGELEVKNYDGFTLPTGSNPVCGIGLVEVYDSSAVLILSGSF